MLDMLWEGGMKELGRHNGKQKRDKNSILWVEIGWNIRDFFLNLRHFWNATSSTWNQWYSRNITVLNIYISIMKH